VHARIEAWLERLITTGVLEPGDRLPAEVEMAASLGTSRMTLRQALGSLEAKGYLVRKPGRRGGTFIARPKVEYDLSGLLGLTEQLRRTRPRPDARVVAATTEAPSSPVREALRLTARSEVHRVVRVHSAGGEPVALEESCFPAAALPGFLSEVLTRPLHALLDRRGRAPTSACEVIEPVTATAERAALLDVPVGAPLLLVARTSFDRDGVAIEHSLEHHRADRMRIVVRTRLDGAPLADVVADP
jgi:GntR family transcriptional regulator